jgi:hypothetical protein
VKVNADVLAGLIQIGAMTLQIVQAKMAARQLAATSAEGVAMTPEQFAAHFTAFEAAADKAGDNAAGRIVQRECGAPEPEVSPTEG